MSRKILFINKAFSFFVALLLTCAFLASLIEVAFAENQIESSSNISVKEKFEENIWNRIRLSNESSTY